MSAPESIPPSAETPALVWRQIEPELRGANLAWREGNAGRGRVGSRRAAGMALRAWLLTAPREPYGTSFMHHLGGAADDPDLPQDVREAAWRLCARPVPEGGFQIAPPEGLTPMSDAERVIAFVAERLPELSAGR